MTFASIDVSVPRRAISAALASAAASVAPLLSTRCSACSLRDLCLPRDLAGDDMQQLERLATGRRRVSAGQTLYRAGERFQFVYAVRSGTFKTSLALSDGREQVSGFQMTGELMGLDGAGGGSCTSTAIALEDAEICSISYDHLAEVSARSGSLQNIVGRLMSREIVREHSLMLLLGSMNAEERLAVFLLNLSQRLKARGYSPSEFHLRMSRAEIGSYLGMKLETVSRTYSALQQRGLLEVDKRHIRIVDLDAFKRAFEPQVH